MSVWYQARAVEDARWHLCAADGAKILLADKDWRSRFHAAEHPLSHASFPGSTTVICQCPGSHSKIDANCIGQVEDFVQQNRVMRPRDSGSVIAALAAGNGQVFLCKGHGLMVAGDSGYVLLQAYKILEAEVREKDKLKEFLSVLRKPTGPCPEHFLDHMLRGAKGAKHFPDVDLDDPRQLADIFHSFFRRFLDNIPPIEKGRSWHYLGKFSKGPMKGKVFSFRTDKGKGVLINGFELVDKDHWAYTHLDVDINNLKRYCHRASDALLPGRIGGGFGAGLGGYCAEQLYHRICADFDHQISQIEAVSMQIGRAASIPVGITVGGNVATYFAGLQSVSMLGPVKFQMCALLAGSGAGFLVGAAITGGSAVVGLTVDTMWRETAECLKLAQAAKERCVQLQGHVQTIQQDMTLRLNAIASDIDSVERMVCNAQQTLKAGMKSEEEILQWIGVGQAGKLVLQHILLAIEKLEEDIYKHLQCLRDEHAKTEQDLRAAVRRQENDDNPPTLVAFLWSAPLCLFGPVGMCATALFTGLSAARKYSLQNAIDYHVRTCALLQEAMKQLKSATGTCAKNRRTCCDLIEKIEYALDRWYARLHRADGLRTVEPAVGGAVALALTAGEMVLEGDPGSPEPNPKDFIGVDASFCYFLVERDFHTGQALRRWRHGGRSRKVGAESPALADGAEEMKVTAHKGTRFYLRAAENMLKGAR
ncbi:unnamed protein product [Durusdinium trenchii]|uniref:Uncharacterized protein n=1 Tax=Durusdinium trenchii TaxID=1381693 RepID=A0ABP0NXG7_9DINO